MIQRSSEQPGQRQKVNQFSRERFNNSLLSQSLSHWSSLPVRPWLIHTDFYFLFFYFFLRSDPNNILLGQSCGLHQSSSSDFCSWKSLVGISIDFPKAKYCCSCLYIHPEVSSVLKEVSSQLSLTYRPSHHQKTSYKHIFGLFLICLLLLWPCLSVSSFLAAFFFCFAKEMCFKHPCRTEVLHYKRHCIIYLVLRQHRWKQSGLKSLVVMLGK